jgi:hypothetical protein
MTETPPFVCPICRRQSWHPRDGAERFCAVCGFVDDVLAAQVLERETKDNAPPPEEAHHPPSDGCPTPYAAGMTG